MLISKRNVCIALVIASAVVAQVGCGPKAGKRLRVERMKDSKATPPAGGQDTNVDTSTSGESDSSDMISADGSSAKIQALLDKQLELTSGSGVNAKELGKLLGAGTYTLNSLFITYHFIKAPADFVAVFKSKVNIDNNVAYVADTSDSDKQGSTAPDIDQGAEIEAPLHFKMGADNSVSRTDIVSTGIKNTNTDEKISVGFNTVPADTKTSLTNILTSADAGGAVIKVLEADAGSTLRISVELKEDADGASITRVIILDYAFTSDQQAAKTDTVVTESDRR